MRLAPDSGFSFTEVKAILRPSQHAETMELYVGIIETSSAWDAFPHCRQSGQPCLKITHRRYRAAALAYLIVWFV
jgi:hypothetical protein